jgi:TPP-dependent pyruvate/acetoin dehydrogenase alpha subunit
MIQAMTYRFSGHSRSDPAKYRPAGELESWRERDPIPRFAAVLGTSFGVTSAELQRLMTDAEEAVAQAADAARTAPSPEPAALLQDVWA